MSDRSMAAAGPQVEDPESPDTAAVADTTAGPDTAAVADTTAVPDAADALARSVLGGITDPTPEDHLVLVRRAAAAEQHAKALLQETINSARAAGHSWATIGQVLGLTRQAVQQRFGGAAAAVTGEERWLGPVTAFDEMPELEAAGRMGWHTIGVGMLKHRMVRTDTQWEHRRYLWPAPAGLLEKDGWRIGSRAFPWVYLIRDTGRPVPNDG